MQKDKAKVLYFNFNQDCSRITIGTQIGFKVFSVSPFKQVFEREFGGGIGIIQTIYTTNILAIVGGGQNPQFPHNKVLIWDDSAGKSIAETNCKSQVRAVRLRPDRCVLALDTKVFVFNLSDFKVLDLLDTCQNTMGLCSVASQTDSLIMAIPSKKQGTVEIVFESPSQKQKIDAHKSPIFALELSPTGSRVATASEKGTIIRVFDVIKGEPLQQLRRGSDSALIFSLAFDSKEQWLACACDIGVVNIFNLKQIASSEIKVSQQSRNKKSKSFFRMFSSSSEQQLSFADYNIPKNRLTKVCFADTPETLIITNIQGRIIIVNFDSQKGGQCAKKIEYSIFGAD